jgi:hypothetical protein
MTVATPIYLEVTRADGLPMNWHDWLLIGLFVTMILTVPLGLAIWNHRHLNRKPKE